MNKHELVAYIQQRVAADKDFTALFSGDWMARAKHLKIKPIHYAMFIYLRFIELHTLEETDISPEAYDAIKGYFHGYQLSGRKKVNSEAFTSLLKKTGLPHTVINNILIQHLPYQARYAEECIALTDKLAHIKEAILNETDLTAEEKLTPSDYDALGVAMAYNRYYEKIVLDSTRNGNKIFTTLLSDDLRKLYNVGALFEEVLGLCATDIREYYQKKKPDILFIDWEKESRMYAHADHAHHQVMNLKWSMAKLRMIRAVTKKHHTAALVPKVDAPLGLFIDEIYPEHQQSALTIHHLLISEPCHLVLVNLLNDKVREPLIDRLGSEPALETYLREMFDKISIKLMDDIHVQGSMKNPTKGLFKRVIKPSIKKLTHTHRSSSPEAAESIDSELTHSGEPKDISNMLCSGYVARRLLTILHRMNLLLTDAHPDIVGIESGMKLPFMNRPLNSVFPDELMSDLTKMHAIQTCAPPRLFSKVVRI